MPSASILTTGAIAACMTLAAGPALAAGEIPVTTPSADTAFTVGELVVTAERTAPAALATSVDRLSPSVIERQSVDDAWELFGRLPGVVLTDFNQGATSGRFSFRAFNGEGEINAVRLLIDGVPSNTNDGGMPFLDMIFPLQIASAATVRGTLDACYGRFNIAGDAEVKTRQGGDYLDGRLGYDGWGAGRLFRRGAGSPGSPA